MAISFFSAVCNSEAAKIIPENVKTRLQAYQKGRTVVLFAVKLIKRDCGTSSIKAKSLSLSPFFAMPL